jgi:TorA maturation chaperone TorD
MQQLPESSVSDRQASIHSSGQEGAEARVETYALLAALLRDAPDNQMLTALSGLKPEYSSSQRATKLEQARYDLAETADAADPEPIEREFHNLFIGVGQGELLPYGSYYLTGFLMDKPLATLRDELRRLGIQRAEGVAEPEDHAAAICETMALLVDPEHGIPLAGQQKFFSEYVGNWMPKFFSDIQGAKNAAFYRPVGQLGEAFMEFERVWLSLPE